MASLSANLKTLMSHSKINASELARRTGIAQPIIHRLSTGQNINPKLATIKPISRYFMITVSQLIGESPIEGQQKVDAQNQNWNRVPLISWKDAIKWQELTTQQQQPETLYVTTDAKVSNQAYSLIIKGRGTEPLFPEGTTIIVEPKRKPIDRDFVLVHIPGEEEPQLKQVVVNGNEHFLKSINPTVDETKIMLRLSAAGQFLGVMAQAKFDF